MMFFERIEIRNWKNFNNAEMSLSDRMFIVGANASGKSNLMDVFRFLKDIVSDGLVKAVESRGGIKKIRFLNARDPSYIEIKVVIKENSDNNEINHWMYQLQFNSAGGSKGKSSVNISLERIEKNGAEILSRKYNNENEDHTTRQYTYLEQPAINTPFRVLYDYFKSISYVNIIPQLIKEDSLFLPSASKEDYYGRNLLNTIAEVPDRTRNSRLKTISKIVQLAVPQFQELSFEVDEKGKPHLKTLYKHYRPQGAYQQEDQFSDGTLRLIGLVWAVLDGSGLLLLEEPELYLHSEIVKQLPMFIERAQKQKNGHKRQVIISSHSFDILNTDTIEPIEIALLQPLKESTRIDLASSRDEVNSMIKAGFTPADAVMPLVTPQGIADGQLSFFNFD